jgi:hypothetical protein
MSTKYSGGFITKSPVAPTSSAASGIWTLDQQQQAQKAGTWPSPPVFIEDLFSTYLYTGTGADLTITNNIDLSTKGGMVWIKDRTSAYGTQVYDTVRGAGLRIGTYGTFAQQAYTATGLNAFTSTGFSLGDDSTNIGVNRSGDATVSWTFREQPKFFDIVTYTGTGAAQNIAHSLGSTPGFIIVKSTSNADGWYCYHRSLGATQYVVLNSTNAVEAVASVWNNTEPTSTVFTVGSFSEVNGSGQTFVAYVFAHDAGGFPVSGGGSTNGISCGSYTATGNDTINLGYEPQWLLEKRVSNDGDDWQIVDNMRGFSTTNIQILAPNTTAAETSSGAFRQPTATGYINTYWSSGTIIYIAIRRGPMKTPTVGTSVFTPILTGSSASNLTDTYSSIGFPIDMTLRYQTGTDTDGAFKNAVYTRLMGINSGATDTPTSANNPNLLTHSTAAQIATYYYAQTGSMGINYGGSWSAPDYVLTHLHFKRAPGFFDVVCYTGTGANRTVTHNLAAVPELMIIKARIAGGYDWMVYQKDLGNTLLLKLNETGTGTNRAAFLNSTTPTASVFTVGTDDLTNVSAGTFVSYLFATCAGVSKVGSYTGNGSSQTIACGFTAGSRFVMIKRTDSTGDWYVWDSARGIVAGNDPHLSLNTTAAEVTTDDSVDTDNSGFIVNQDAATNVNVTSATYIFLAIA